MEVEDDLPAVSFDAETLLDASPERTFRQLPRLVIQAVSLVWRAGRRELILTTLLQVLGGAALAAQLLVARSLLGHLLARQASRDFSSAIPSVVALVVILALSGVVTVLRTELQRLLAELVSRSAMALVIDAATSADLLRFESPTFHDRLQRSIVNASIRPLQMTTGILTVGASLLSCAAVGVTLLVIQPLFFVLALVAVVPITFVTLRVGRALYRFALEQTPTDRQRSYIQTLLVEKDPAKEIRAYGLERHLGDRFDSLYAGRIAALRRLVRSRMRQGILGSLLTAVISGATLGLLILLVSDGRTSLAAAGAGAAALILLGSQLQGLASGVGQLYESALFVRDFNDFIAWVPTARRFTGTLPVPDGPGRITVSELSFTYPSRLHASLEDISLTIEPGQVVALVGENGSGKTTLAKLLAGLYPVGAGSITRDGIDVTTLDVTDLRSRTAVLFQDFVHYFLSARENITLGRVEGAGDDDSVRRAAVRAGADTFLSALPDGYQTFLGPQFFGGSDLSGGQWQRVALARAFYRNADLVILDEPTAALDPRSEAALFEAVRSLFAGRSVVLISHRFSSVALADAIFVLAEGRIVERGNHAELLDADGLYAELFHLQAAAFHSSKAG